MRFGGAFTGFIPAGPRSSPAQSSAFRCVVGSILARVDRLRLLGNWGAYDTDQPMGAMLLAFVPFRFCFRDQHGDFVVQRARGGRMVRNAIQGSRDQGGC